MRYGPMLILLMLPAPAALADVTLAYGDAAQQPTYTLSIQGDRLRMETHDDAGSVVLFDAAKREMTVVDAGRREYLVVVGFHPQLVAVDGQRVGRLLRGVLVREGHVGQGGRRGQQQ